MRLTRISVMKREKGFLSWLSRDYEEVYLQKGYEGEDADITNFEKEDLWLGCFNSLYELAIKQKDLENAKDNFKNLESSIALN